MKNIFENTYWYMRGYALGNNHFFTFGIKKTITPPKDANECYLQGYSDAFEINCRT